MRLHWRRDDHASLTGSTRINTKRGVFAGLGTIGMLLGGLWCLQGLGLVQLRPIVCFAACEPIRGPSVSWASIGAVVGLLGAAALWRAFFRPAGPMKPLQ